MRKFLIIRLSSIGDIILTSPVARCIKQQIADAEVHYLTRQQYTPLLQANPYVDKVFAYKNDLKELISLLKLEQYELIVDLHKNMRSKKIRLKLRRKSSTFNKINVRKWLAVNFKMKVLPDIHIVDRYFEATKHIGVVNDQKGLDYFIPEADEVTQESLPSGFENAYLAWAIGGNHKTKILPENKVIETCQKLNLPVVLLGGPEDAAKAAVIEKACGDLVYNGCGRFNVNQSASVLKNSVLVLTNDTGMMHAAAAFKKKIISFWGNTIPEFGMVPYLPGQETNSKILEVHDLSCRPCSKIGFAECPKKHFDCMQKMDTNVVASSVAELTSKS